MITIFRYSYRCLFASVRYQSNKIIALYADRDHAPAVVQYISRLQSPSQSFFKLLVEPRVSYADGNSLFCFAAVVFFLIMSPLRRHIFVCFMAKSVFLVVFSALAP